MPVSRLEMQFQINGRKQFNDVGRALGRVERSIPRDVDKAIVREQKANAKQAKADVLAEPAVGKDGSTGLRKRISKGVGVMPIESGDGYKGHRVYTSMPEEDEAVIPLGFDTRKGFRHPLFGDKEDWYDQYAEFSWFMDNMREAFAKLPPRVEEILDDAADTIDRSAKQL